LWEKYVILVYSTYLQEMFSVFLKKFMDVDGMDEHDVKEIQ